MLRYILMKMRKTSVNILSFSIVYLVPLSVWLGYQLGGMYTFTTPFFIFVIVPLLDLLIGRDTRNPSEETIKRLESDMRYRLLTICCAPIQVGLVIWGAYVVIHGNLSIAEEIGFILSVGISSGVLGINVAHELAHRVNERVEPFLSKIMLLTVCYIHWGLEHVVGHHRRVATPQDPATARSGESFYAFWPRTVFGGFNSAWEFEANRMKKKNMPVWNMHNPMALAIFVQIIYVVFIAIVFGGKGVVYILGQSLIAISLLEIVNYVEHYGLLRNETSPGKYESVKPHHSWNSSNWLTNRFLFNLQRHSDHHYKPGRRYQLLRHYDDSPQLPSGYAGMIVLAAIPFLWRRIMDPIVPDMVND